MEYSLPTDPLICEERAIHYVVSGLLDDGLTEADALLKAPQLLFSMVPPIGGNGRFPKPMAVAGVRRVNRRGAGDRDRRPNWDHGFVGRAEPGFRSGWSSAIVRRGF